MKTLVVGDIHCKPHLIEMVARQARSFNKIVFLGDYVDDWDASPELSRLTLEVLIQFKKAHPRKVVLLCGNHCLSEWFGDYFRCSGYNPETHSLVKDLYSENHKLFDIAYYDGHYLYSHAGFTSRWVREQDLPKDPSELARVVNRIFQHPSARKHSQQVFRALAQAGSVRGGMGNPSPVWADRQELMENPLPFVNQVVGHSPVPTVERHNFKNEDGSRNHLYFCDTFSTMYEAWTGLSLPIGDSSFLVITTDSAGRVGQEIIKINT